MVRIAITGHRGLPADTVRLVDDAVRSALAEHDAERLTGISCLADGADQIFARAVVDLGGALEVVVPARRYREGLCFTMSRSARGETTTSASSSEVCG